MGYRAYANSALLNKIDQRTKANQTIRLAFLDIDSTMTGSEAATNATRQKLEELGYIIIYVTARTEEMVMSSTAYLASRKHGFDRPVPLLGKDKKKCIYTPPESVVPCGLLDPDIIAGSTGSVILVRQKDGSYLPDAEYEETFEEDSLSWKKTMLHLIRQFNRDGKKAFTAPFDTALNYEKGKADVYPQKYRLTLTFKSQREKRAFRAFIRKIREEQSLPLNLHITDDSKEKKEKFLLILTPRLASKRHAVDQIINQITNQKQLKRSSLQVLLAGDGLPDIDMGLLGAKDTRATFVLAGGSHMSHALTCNKEHDEALEGIVQDLKDYLHPHEKKGHYGHKLYTNHKIIILDEIQQKGVLQEVSVASILALLNDVATHS